MEGMGNSVVPNRGFFLLSSLCQRWYLRSEAVDTAQFGTTGGKTMATTAASRCVGRLVLCLVFFSPFAFAQKPTGTIKGTLVDDEKDRPVRGAIVYLIGSDVKTKSTFKGEFTLTVPAGAYAGLVVERPRGGGAFSIEAELAIEASAEEDLGEIGVPSPLSRPPVPEPVPQGATPEVAVETPPSAPAAPVVPEVQPPETTPPEPQAEPAAPQLPPATSVAQQAVGTATALADVPKPWLGVLMADWFIAENRKAERSEKSVIKILKVFEGSPAEKAGFREGDFLISLNGEKLGKFEDFSKRMEKYSPGQEARFILLRDYQFHEVKTVLEMIPQSVLDVLNQPGHTEEQLENLNPSGIQEPAPAPVFQVPKTEASPVVPPPAAPPSAAPPPMSSPPSVSVPRAAENPPPPQVGQVPPLIQEARNLTDQGKFIPASQKYDEHLLHYPEDGFALAEQAEMVYFHIQKARGLALMAQAAKKSSLPVPERTRLRLIIAHHRLESGNLLTAKQILMEAQRDDPGHPTVNLLLGRIAAIEAEIREEARRRNQPQYYDPHLHEELMKIIMDEILD